MINAMTLILILLIFRFLMVTFLAVRRMVYTFRNLLALLESALMLRTLAREINVKQPNFFSRAIGIINFEKRFLNFIADTMK